MLFYFIKKIKWIFDDYCKKKKKQNAIAISPIVIMIIIFYHFNFSTYTLEKCYGNFIIAFFIIIF